VTNAQYRAVMGAVPTGPKGPSRDDNLPVVLVTWPEATEFCTKLTEKEKGQPWGRSGWEYRLPTEIEWEYACRAGTETPTAFGPHLAFGKHAVFLAVGADPIEAPGTPKTIQPTVQDVGKTDPNKFGLHDMHGNVAEWCRDLFRPDAKEGPRVIRGGSFRDPASAARSAARERLAPLDRRDWVGFRVVYAPRTDK
jgi:eukaryotic-like serine/threonine-protein kinase